MVKIKQMLIISREEYWSRDVGLKVNPKEKKLQVPKGRYGGHTLSADILNQILTNCDQSVRCESFQLPGPLKFIKRKANLQEPIPQLKM